jgi:putative transposase
LAVDFCVVDIVWLSQHYVLFAIELKSRAVHLLGVTSHPDGPWATQLAPNFLSDLEENGRSFKFLVRDRDSKFTASFDAVFASEGTRVITCPVRSPLLSGQSRCASDVMKRHRLAGCNSGYPGRQANQSPIGRIT